MFLDAFVCDLKLLAGNGPPLLRVPSRPRMEIDAHLPHEPRAVRAHVSLEVLPNLARERR